MFYDGINAKVFRRSIAFAIVIVVMSRSSFDIKLKKSRSVFDLVTVLISKQSFIQHRVWPVKQGKSFIHGIALPDFYIVGSFFYKKSKQARVPAFVWLFRDATSAKGPGCDEGTNLR